jgi:4-hydroxy-3-methylbut-2-enyl diphosphate reductase
MSLKKVIVARPRGFCAGVVRAVEIVEKALELYPPPVYVFHEIVHNRYVVENLRRLKAVFVNSLEEIPEDSVCVFSAHGVSPQIRDLAVQRRLRVIDATCPLVTKVHLEAIRFAREGHTIVLIGHPGHEEVEGTMGEAPMHLVSSVEDVEKLQVLNPEKVVYITQTTLSLDDTASIVKAMQAKFPKLRSPQKDDICYATQNRQNAVKSMDQKADLILVIGSQNSSNSQRLREVALSSGVPSYLINDESEINTDWFNGVEVVGVTAGASAPEEFVLRVIDRLKDLGAAVVEEMDAEIENVYFALPPELVTASRP